MKNSLSPSKSANNVSSPTNPFSKVEPSLTSTSPANPARSPSSSRKGPVVKTSIKKQKNVSEEEAPKEAETQPNKLKPTTENKESAKSPSRKPSINKNNPKGSPVKKVSKNLTASKTDEKVTPKVNDKKDKY